MFSEKEVRMIKKKVSVLFILSGFLSVCAMSLQEMKEHAFLNSEKVQQIELSLLRAESLKREYYAKGFPEINLGLKYLYQPRAYNPFDFGPFPSVLEMMDPTQEGYLNDAMLAGTLDQLFSNLDLAPKQQALQWEITATQPIFAQGKITAGVRIAKLYTEMISLQHQQLLSELAEQISHSYFKALVAEENLVTQRRAVELSEEAHRLSVRRYEVGKGTLLDTLNSRYTLQRDIYSLREAEKNRRLAVQQLLTTVSFDLCPDSFLLSDSLSENYLPTTFDQAHEVMLQSNHSLQVLRKGELLQQRQTHLMRTDYFPTVFAGATAGQISQHDAFGDINLRSDAWDVKIFAGVNVPVWNGGQRRHRMAQAYTEELKIASQIKEIEDLLTLALSAAFEEYQLAIENLSAVREMKAVAEKASSVAQRAFEVGHITQLELNQNHQNVNLTRLAYTDALYRLSKAQVKIQKLTGNPQLIHN
ncbi:putative outer membrane efflux protein [Chitinispirillum alkaliphilum]|nr:putative outer membrane efflux protein [Chitinispirillum alkaliphilum]